MPLGGWGINNAAFRFRTPLAASIDKLATALVEGVERQLISVVDLKDGVPAFGVAPSAPFSAPAVMTYWAQKSPTEWQGPNRPVTIADGAEQMFAIDFAPAVLADPARVEVMIKGANTAAAAGGVVVNVGGVAADWAKLHVHHPLTTGQDPTPTPATIEDACGRIRVFPDNLSYGYLPTQAFAPRAHELVRPIGPRPRVFWDSERETIVTAEHLNAAPVVFDMLANVTPDWLQRNEIEFAQAAPPLIRYTAPGQIPRALVFEDVSLESSAVACFLFTVKLANSHNPYVSLFWQGEGSEPFNGTKVASLPSIPDGRWRTYAVALHPLPAWRDHGVVGRLQVVVGSEKALVEIARLQLLGSIPLPGDVNL